MKTITALLKQTELFSGLPESTLLLDILPHGQKQEFSKGQYMIVPQQYVEKVGVVLAGKVNVMHIFPDGNYSLMTSLLPADILGADLVCTKSRISPYYAQAAEPTRILYFPIELLTCPGKLPESCRLDILNHLLTLISHANMKKEYRLAILSQKGLRERIMTYLTMQSDRLRTSSFEIPFSRDELASFLCVNRSALSHELSLMQQEGLLSFRKNRFTLQNLGDT